MYNDVIYYVIKRKKKASEKKRKKGERPKVGGGVWEEGRVYMCISSTLLISNTTKDVR